MFFAPKMASNDDSQCSLKPFQSTRVLIFTLSVVVAFYSLSSSIALLLKHSNAITHDTQNDLNSSINPQQQQLVTNAPPSIHANDSDILSQTQWEHNVHHNRSLNPPPDIPDSHVCDLAQHSFTKASGLHSIVTGLEHSGTTIMLQLIASAPEVFGGLECGVLLSPEPSRFNSTDPFYKWMADINHFGLNAQLRDEWLLTSECHAQMFHRIRAHSTFFQQSPHEQFRKSWIVDKTPRYIRFLDVIMDRTPNVPVVIMRKDEADQIRSIVKYMMRPGSSRAGYPIRKMRRLAKLAMKKGRLGMERAIAKYGSSGRILVVNSTQLYADPNGVMNSVFDFLGLRWRSEYLTMDALNTKRLLVGVDRNLTAFNPNALRNPHPTKKSVNDK
jgi:hypothetical protein